MNKVSCVLMVDYYQKYIKTNLSISSLYNHIYLIGIPEMSYLESEKITFVDINKYKDNKFLKNMKKNFKNYGAKDDKSELFWLSRVPKLRNFLEEYKLEKIFVIDSDNILLCDVNLYPFSEKNAICISPNFNKYHQTASIHSGLIDKSFCEAYENLYCDIFENKSKFYLIEDKINFHKNNPGGIADMTLYYHLYNEGLVEFDNLLKPVDYQGEKSVFINHYLTSEGFESEDQFQLNRNKLKIYRRNGSNFVYDKKNNEYLKLLNIHFQGIGKKYLNNRLRFKINL